MRGSATSYSVGDPGHCLHEPPLGQWPEPVPVVGDLQLGSSRPGPHDGFANATETGSRTSPPTSSSPRSTPAVAPPPWSPSTQHRWDPWPPIEPTPLLAPPTPWAASSRSEHHWPRPLSCYLACFSRFATVVRCQRDPRAGTSSSFSRSVITRRLMPRPLIFRMRVKTRCSLRLGSNLTPSLATR